MTTTIPDLGYIPVPDIFKLPAGVNFGPCSGVAVNAKNNVLVFNRSENALMEFTAAGDWVRTMGRGIFTLPHGLRIDREGNIWCTDTGAHIVVKMNADGRILMVLGVAGRAGDWHHAGHMKCFDEPNDLAFGANGEVYITQGHGKGDNVVHKFTANGDHVKTWGGTGKEKGQFNQPHSIVINGKGLLYIADRSNQRIQVFDGDGNYLRETHHAGTPCGLAMCNDQRHMMMAHGHAGKIMKLDDECNVLGITGSQGKGPNQYGEAHYIALDHNEDIYVGDTLNWRVQKLVKK
jgi:DNA-binding beta-propeller fold protein YncE